MNKQLTRRASRVSQWARILLQCRRHLSLGWEMAAHSNILAWEIPWTEKAVGLQSMGLYSQTQPSAKITKHFHERYILKMYSAVCKAFSNTKTTTTCTKAMCSTSFVCRSTLHPSPDLCPRGWLLCASFWLPAGFKDRRKQCLKAGWSPGSHPIARFFLNSGSWNCSPALIA